MAYNVIIKPGASFEIHEAFFWYENQAEGLGFEFLRSFKASTFSIKRSPLLYPVIYRQVRRTLMRKFPYGIYYTVDEQTISVLSCFHGRQNPRKLHEILKL